MLDIREEAKAVMRYLKRGAWIQDEDLVDEIGYNLLKADWDWKDGYNCSKETLRIVYAKTVLRNYRRYTKAEKLYRSSFRLDKEIKKANITFRDLIPQKINTSNVDGEKLLKIIRKATIQHNPETAKRTQKIIHDIYFLGMNQVEVAKKYKVDKRRVQQILENTFNRVRKLIDKEELIC